MKRRHFLAQAAALAGAGVLPLEQAFSNNPNRVDSLNSSVWRSFEVTTDINIPASGSSVKVWLPLPTFHAREWTRPMGSVWQGNAFDAYVHKHSAQSAQMLFAEWQNASVEPTLSVVSRFMVKDRQWEEASTRPVIPLSAEERVHYTASTQLLPIDGIVLSSAKDIVGSLRHDEDKARAIYQWIIENTFRDSETQGCGVGDIRYMLESGNLGGKCADLNALYVGLARSVGLPARDLYGIRVADSRIGFKSLGKSGDISKAQHCRAEVYLEAHGWVPVDPADVRKVALEEPPGNHAIDAPLVMEARDLLFGSWESNWLVYNDAHDVQLPYSNGRPLPFLMYPQAEIDGRRLNSLDPSSFIYSIRSKEIS